MRGINDPKALPRKRRIYEERVGSADRAVPAVQMSKDMKHWLYPAHSGEKLAASCVVVGVRSLVEQAVWRAVGYEDIDIVGDSRVETLSILVRGNSERFTEKRRCRRPPDFQAHDFNALIDQECGVRDQIAPGRVFDYEVMISWDDNAKGVMLGAQPFIKIDEHLSTQAVHGEITGMDQ